MTSVYDDDVVEDLLSGNLHELPSDDENERNGIGREDPFGEEGEGGAGANADEEQQGVKVEPKKRTVRNPRPKLSLDILTGTRGIHTIEDYFKDIKFKGKGQEQRDLDEVMRRMAHWAHRMYPNYTFDDVLTNIERIGKKKSLQVHMSRYRLGMLENLKNTAEEIREEGDYNGGDPEAADEPFDEFDALLGEQIAISKLAPRTPSHYSVCSDGVDAAFTGTSSSTLATPSFHRDNAVMSTPYTSVGHLDNKLNDSDLARPLPPSQPASPAPAPASSTAPKLTVEQLATIAENRRIALERLKAKKERLQQQQNEADREMIEI